jgi:hypothetical protein
MRNVLILFLLIFQVSLLSAQVNSDFLKRDASGIFDIRLSIKDYHNFPENDRLDVIRISGDSIDIHYGSDLAQIPSTISYRVIPQEKIQELPKLKDFQQYISQNFNSYPTYQQYDSIMMAFADSFPQIAQYVVLGTLPSGRKIVALHISDNVNAKEAEPRFLYTATMHGNETAGYIMMLKLIKLLLEGYGTNPEATMLVDSIDIWINPLANPDGSYYGGNHTISQAIRNNSNNVNLNRNYPDPEDGPHPDGNAYQAETMIFMGLADTLTFTMSSNLHGGAEVCNYPWDTWSRLPADVDWWESVCTQYADSAHRNSNYNGYLTDFNTGVTNGYQWYSISGGRQDFMNYFHYCRELTLELSNTKLLPENQLDIYWNYNKRSLLDYMNQVNYGLRGYVRDSISHAPLKAKVEILNFDKDSSHVYSSALHGDFYRLLDSGYCTLRFSASGYYSKTIDSVWIAKNTCSHLEVDLLKNTIGLNEVFSKKHELTAFPNPADERVSILLPEAGKSYQLQVFEPSGKLLLDRWTNQGDMLTTLNVKYWNNGVYYLVLKNSCNASAYHSRLLVKH